MHFAPKKVFNLHLTGYEFCRIEPILHFGLTDRS